MGKLIICLGAQENIGNTTVSLALSTILASKIGKPVLMVDGDRGNPSVFNYLSGDDSPIQSLDNVMSYAYADEDINSVIKANVETMTNSSLEILMGSTLDSSYTAVQISNFLKCVKKNYEITVIDASLDTIQDVQLAYADTIIISVSQSNDILTRLNKENSKILTDGRTVILANKYESSVMSTKVIGNTLNNKTVYMVSYNKEVIKQLNKRNLNFGETKFQGEVSYIADEMLHRYGMKKKERFSIGKLLKSSKGKNSKSKGVSGYAKFTK